MPSGYLKHQPGVSRKLARGGGSHSRTEKVESNRPHKSVARRRESAMMVLSSDHDYQFDEHGDNHGPAPKAWVCSACTFHNTNMDFLACAVCRTEKADNSRTLDTVEVAPKPQTLGTCSICCEDDVSLIFLMKNCKKTHEPACYDCLRRIHVTDAQQSISNYPLKCHHPQCRLPVLETQLTKHELVQSKDELRKYFRFMELAKGHRGGDQTTTAYCPECDHPRTFRSAGGLYRIFACRECRFEYVVPEYEGVVAALEGLPMDDVGINDGWAQCPRCKMLISKGWGCDHMQCGLCGHDFSWSWAQSRRGKYATRPLAN